MNLSVVHINTQMNFPFSEESGGKLTVVGAGPGDEELITLKGIKALQSADVVLYDALVNTQLLTYAGEAEKIFVGKRKGCYAYQQEQINELIVQRAQSGKHVVRLNHRAGLLREAGSARTGYERYARQSRPRPGRRDRRR